MRRSVPELIIRVFYRLYRNLILIPFDFKNKRKFQKLSNAYKGKRAFIIGNGPSLNHTPLYLLKDEHVLCFNRFNLIGERLNFTPDMYMIVDDIVAKDNVDEVKEQIKRSKVTFLPNINFGTGVTNFKKLFKGCDNIVWMNILVKRFSSKRLNTVMKRSFPWVVIGRTVATSGLEILMKMGFSEIYILGVDMNYIIHKTVKKIDNDTHIESTKNDDPNHFDPRYFGKGKQYHQPIAETMDIMMRALADISCYAKNNGYKIYNATVGGKVECFERVNIYDVFKSKNQEEMFNQLILDKTGLCINDINFNKIITDVNQISNDEHYFVIDENQIETVIKLYINEYLPLGPYKGKYLIINRNIIK